MNPQEQAALNHDRAGAILENQRAIMVNQATILQNQNKIMRGLENLFTILPNLQTVQSNITGHGQPAYNPIPIATSVSVSSENTGTVLPLRVPSVSLIPAVATVASTVPENIVTTPLNQPSVLPHNSAQITPASNASIPTSCNIPDNQISNTIPVVAVSEDDMKLKSDNSNETAAPSDSETNPISPSVDPSTATVHIENSSLVSISSCEQPLNQLIPRDELIQMRVKSCSVGNFAVHVLRRVCTQSELENRNCSGSRGKEAVDQKRLRYVKDTVFSLYAVPAAEKINTWRQCVRAIDEFLRRPKRTSYKIRVKNQSQTPEM